MNKMLQEKRERIIKLNELLKFSKLSSDDYKSIDKPFFQEDINIINFEMNFKDIGDIPSDLNKNFIMMYNIIGNPKVEVYINEWTILSLDEARSQYEDYCDHNQFNVFNIAYRYMGLGHVEVLSCNLYNHLLFLRNDGGSNGYERADNYNEILNFDHKKYKYFGFEKWYNENICKVIKQNDNRKECC